MSKRPDCLNGNNGQEFSWLEFPESPVLLNHYTLRPRTQNISVAVAGEYIQKSFKRLFLDRPSYTACYGNNEVHIHPTVNRRLTVREAARIQNFPDYWCFLGGLTSEFKQIGNAVPPTLAYGVIKTVAEFFSFETRKAISLFSGIGGLDIGAESAGLKVLGCFEIDENCVRGLQLNKEIGKRTKIHNFLQHSAIIQADLSKEHNTSANFLRKSCNDELSDVELLIGGPPCQAFSSAGSRKGLNDERGMLYLGYLNVLKSIRPKCFVFENVIGLKRLEKGKVLDLIVHDFSRLGYNVRVVSLNAVNFGVPQFRERVFVIGTFESNLTLDRFERKLSSIRTRERSTREVLLGLPPARLAPKSHHFDEHYKNAQDVWDLGGSVFSENQPELPLL